MSIDNDFRKNKWVTETVHCEKCNRKMVVVMTFYHWETKTGEIFEDLRCMPCKVLDKVSKN